MHPKFAGDSYDIVKRFWREILSTDEKLMIAHPDFFREGDGIPFTRLTGIPLGDGSQFEDSNYLMLLDPDTGIQLLNSNATTSRFKHAKLQWIAEEVMAKQRPNRPELLVVFDQAFSRGNSEIERDEKRSWLVEQGIHSFYYVSHACFLFASRERKALEKCRRRILDEGVPSFTVENKVRVEQIL